MYHPANHIAMTCRLAGNAAKYVMMQCESTCFSNTVSAMNHLAGNQSQKLASHLDFSDPMLMFCNLSIWTLYATWSIMARWLRNFCGLADNKTKTKTKLNHTYIDGIVCQQVSHHQTHVSCLGHSYISRHRWRCSGRCIFQNNFRTNLLPSAKSTRHRNVTIGCDICDLVLFNLVILAELVSSLVSNQPTDRPT